MDEESYQRLEQDCPVRLFNNGQELTDYLSHKGLDSDEIALYIRRRLKGHKWIEDFGPTSLHDALIDLQLSTEDLFLRRLTDRLYNNIDPDIKVRITYPNGRSGSYTIKFFRHTTDRFPEDSEDVYVHGIAPSETIFTLSTSQRGHIFIPLGDLEYEGKITPFTLIWVIEKGEYFLLSNYYYSRFVESLLDIVGAEDPIPAAERISTLPGSDITMSFGLLSGLNIAENKEAVLKVLGTEGFSIYPVRRYDGIWRPLRKDFSVDTRDS